MVANASDELIGTWVRGWAEARGYETRHEGPIHAYRRTGQDAEHWEYVIHNPNAEQLAALATALKEHPGRRVTAFTKDIDALVSQASAAGLELVSQREALMVTDMTVQDVEPPRLEEGLHWEEKRDGSHAWVSLHRSSDGAVMASGHVAAIDDYAVFDRIVTAPEFRRRGYGSLVTRYLASIATESDADEGLLVASTDGYELYKYLGWTLLGTMAVLEAPNTQDGHERVGHTA
ncbi:GNAT family N-acetyltransferase [Galactobacter valiniphilus]|uniref:GNAT family N-acetyltransferase n=1 Tax=Galactobacter valiniphilus TaxID=2676122 RepID=A0A399JHU2_9MICC|nr:GNAT family N-acetyltransferase [Galactobacter valiniphilus]RII43779.1 GNAT family N-acetyltransferase [Galactobacter valiniphilus]